MSFYVFACAPNSAEVLTSCHCHTHHALSRVSRRGQRDCDAGGCRSDIQHDPSTPELDVLVLADSRDAAIAVAFMREQASKRDTEDVRGALPVKQFITGVRGGTLVLLQRI